MSHGKLLLASYCAASRHTVFISFTNDGFFRSNSTTLLALPFLIARKNSCKRLHRVKRHASSLLASQLSRVRFYSVAAHNALVRDLSVDCVRKCLHVRYLQPLSAIQCKCCIQHHSESATLSAIHNYYCLILAGVKIFHCFMRMRRSIFTELVCGCTASQPSPPQWMVQCSLCIFIFVFTQCACLFVCCLLVLSKKNSMDSYQTNQPTNLPIMLYIILYASVNLLCSKLCQHNVDMQPQSSLVRSPDLVSCPDPALSRGKGSGK